VSACFAGSVGYSRFGSLINSSSHRSRRRRHAAKDSQVVCVEMSVLKSAQLDSFRYRPSFPEQPNPLPHLTPFFRLAPTRHLAHSLRDNTARAQFREEG